MITIKRSIWCLLSLMLAALLVSSAVSCSKDDDDDSDGKSSMASQLVGVWLGVDKGETDSYYLSLVLRSDRSADYSQFYMKGTDFKSMADQKGLKWGYKGETSELTVYTSNTQGYVMKVSSFTGTTMVLTVKTKGGDSKNYYMENLGTPKEDDPGTSNPGTSDPGSGNNKCIICGGSGKCSWPGSIYNKYYCQGSGRCANCNGTGQVNNMFGYGKQACTYCAKKVNDSYGNGICGYCQGSGKCHSCGGDGYK